MSKLSQLHAELTEQAAKYGFESISDAEYAGYEIDLLNGKLLTPEEAANRWVQEQKKKAIQFIDEYRREAKGNTPRGFALVSEFSLELFRDLIEEV